MPAITTIKMRRGTAAAWAAANPVLAAGEMGLETDTHVEKRGDGVTAWLSLPTALSGTYVPAAGDTTVAGVKTFSSPPVVPDGAFAQAKIATGAFVPYLTGVDMTGATDVTAALQAAITAGYCKLNPAGIYRIDGTLIVASNKTLELPGEATLRRFSASSAATPPLVRLQGNFPKLLGTGWIITENASTDGIVKVGPPDGTTPTTTNWPRIGPVHVQGLSAAGNIGLSVASNEGGAGGNTYFLITDPMEIRLVGTGVQIAQYANGNQLHGCNFYNLASYAYQVSGDECTVVGGFVHQSTDVTVFKVEGASFFTAYGTQAEPGGTNARFANLDATSNQCKIFGHGNCNQGDIDLGTGNTILNKDVLRVPRLFLAGKESKPEVRRFIPATRLALASGAPNQTIYGGSTNNLPAWMLDAASNESVAGSDTIPADWTTVNVDLWYGNNGAGTGDIVVGVDWQAWEDGVSSGVGNNTGAKSTVTASAQNVVKVLPNVLAGITLDTLTKLARFRVIRYASDAADTLANDMAVIGLMLRKAS